MIPTHALTVRQPWAQGILWQRQTKKFGEFRSWRTRLPEGSHIAIHAAKQRDRTAFQRGLERAPFWSISWPYGRYDCAQGAVVGIVRLGAVSEVDEFLLNMPGCPSPPSGYFWALTEPIILPKPIPCRGQQRLWRIPDDVREQIAVQLEVTE